MNNTDPIKKPPVFAKGKKYLLLIRHPLCYPYIQSRPVQVLAVIEK